MPTIGCGHWNGRRNRLPQLVDQSFGEVGGAGGFACRWKLISIAHRNPENGYAPGEFSVKRGHLLQFDRTSDFSQHSLPYETSTVLPSGHWPRRKTGDER